MKRSELKELSVQKLAKLHKALNIEKLYVRPKHRTIRDWLANTASVLKDLDESDYREFVRLSKSITPTEEREERKKAAYEIDAFTRRKVAEYKKYDFSNLDKEGSILKNSEKFWKWTNPLWLIYRLVFLAWKRKVISLIILTITLLGIDYTLAWKNTLWLINFVKSLVNIKTL